MTKLNEMDDGYASSSIPSVPQPEMTVELPMATIGGDSAIASVETTTPTEIDPDSVNVYALGVTNASTSEGNILAFDVNFSVSFTCPDTGTFSTYQVIKRIGVDKMKMVHEAKMSTPITIVEAKKPETFVHSADRIKALAGLK